MIRPTGERAAGRMHRRGLLRRRLAAPMLFAALFALFAWLYHDGALPWKSPGKRRVAAAPGKAAALAWTTGAAPRRVVMVAGADGAPARALTDPTLDAWCPSLSGDGRKLACLAGGPFAVEPLLIDLPTGGVEPLPFRRGEWLALALSPDGERVAGVLRTAEGIDLFAAEIAGRATRRLTAGEGEVLDPAWSRDGTLLAHASGAPGERLIVVRRADGSDATALALPPGDHRHPGFRPGCRGIVFASDGALFSMDFDSPETLHPLHPGPLAGAPQLTPDGAALLFPVEGEAGADLHELPLSGGMARILARGIAPGAVAVAVPPEPPPILHGFTLDPPAPRVAPSGVMPLSMLRATAHYEGGLALTLSAPAYIVESGGGRIEGDQFVAPSTPGTARLRLAGGGGHERAAPVEIAIVPDRVPVALRLQPNILEAATEKPFDLAKILATVEYSDGAAATVTPAWRVKSGTGTLRGLAYRAGPGEETAVLSARHREAGEERIADLTVSFVPGATLEPEPEPEPLPAAAEGPAPPPPGRDGAQEPPALPPPPAGATGSIPTVPPFDPADPDATGTLIAVSRPRGARLSVDGQERGVTDASFAGLLAGPHRVSFAYGGRTLHTTATVPRGGFVVASADFHANTVAVGDTPPDDGGSAGNFPARSGHAIVGFDRRLRCYGGRDERGAATRDALSSDDGITWRVDSETPGFAARYGHAACEHGGKVFLCGGASPNVHADLYESSDGVSFARITAAAPFGPRFGHALVSFGGRLLLIAGVMRGEPPAPSRGMSDVWASEDGRAWSRIADRTPIPPGPVRAASAGGTLLVASQLSPALFVSTDGISFTPVAAGGALPEAPLALAALDGAAVLLAGSRGGAMATFTLGPERELVPLATGLPMVPRRDAALAPLGRRLFLAGGVSAREGLPLPDVWISADGIRWLEAR